MASRALQRGDVSGVSLSPLETFVLSRFSGTGDVAALGQATGLPPERLEEILSRLVQVGALKEASWSDQEPTLHHETAEDASGAPPAPGAAGSEEADGAEGEESASAEAVPEAEDPAPAALYHQRLKALPVDERIQRARAAVGAELDAFCHDGHHRVIAAVLENPRAGLAQARLIAHHHRDAQGLELLVARAAFAADDVVRRHLLKNPQLQAGAIRRLWGNRRLLEQWKWSTSRETTELARRTLKETVRSRFATGAAEERVELIFKTEGRCLGALSGIPVDSKTTALLCGRTYASTMLIQSLARWSAAAPVLITHLLKQPLVRRTPSLRAMLLAHPNAPREAPH